MDDKEIQALSPDSFLNPQQFITEHDAKVESYGIQQERYGMTTGQASHTILIDRHGTWFAYKLNGGMITSGDERIGIHANTSDLLKGFLASPASIVVQRYENGETTYHCIRQCNHPSVLDFISPVVVFDLNQFVPMWREVGQEQYEHYLGCVPPKRYRTNGFLSGEPYTHTAEGQGVYLACKKVGEQYFAKMMTVAQFDSERF